MELRYFAVSTPRPSGEDGQQADTQVQRGRQHLALHAALEQGVLQLCARQPGPGAGRRELPRRRLGELPAAEVGDTGIAGPAAADRQVEGLEGLVQRGAGVEGVDVPDVDVVRAEPGQRGVQRGEQMAARAVEPAVRVGHAARLRRDHQIPARDQPFYEPAEQVLGLPVAVHVGRVDEGAARLPERFQEVRGIMLVGVPAPGEGAEPDPGHAQAGAAEMPLLHERRDYWPEPAMWGPVDDQFAGRSPGIPMPVGAMPATPASPRGVPRAKVGPTRDVTDR